MDVEKLIMKLPHSMMLRSEGSVCVEGDYDEDGNYKNITASHVGGNVIFGTELLCDPAIRIEVQQEDNGIKSVYIYIGDLVYQAIERDWPGFQVLARLVKEDD